MCTPGVPLTPSYVMRAVREMEHWWGEYELGYQLSIPQSKLKEIRQSFPDEMDQKKQAVLYWINTDPKASWRTLIMALDWMRETKLADSIRSNAEPLTGINTNIYMYMYTCDKRWCSIICWIMSHDTVYHSVPYTILNVYSVSHSHKYQVVK